jgi:serine/threonine protein kinase
MEPLAADDPREIGGYRLIGLLGMGGMGRVFLGRANDSAVAAIKVIHPDRVLDSDYMRRFKREARAARAVSDPYIAPVVKVGVDDSPPWLATAFVPGPSLQEAVLAGPMPTAAVWSLADGLAQALQAVHVGGLVHRDLKPANVLLSSDGPRLIDFGIAKGVTGAGASSVASITQTGIIIGTPGFMSPEQVSGRDVGPQSDVFSLGAVLAFAASGRLPFGDGLPINVALRVLRNEPDLSGIISAELRSLVAGCLAADPLTRPTLHQARRAIAAGRASAPMSWSGSFWPDPLAALVSSRENSYRHYLAPGPARQPHPGTTRQPDPETIGKNEATVTIRGPGGSRGPAGGAGPADATATIGPAAAAGVPGPRPDVSRRGPHGAPAGPAASRPGVPRRVHRPVEAVAKVPCRQSGAVRSLAGPVPAQGGMGTVQGAGRGSHGAGPAAAQGRHPQ